MSARHPFRQAAILVLLALPAVLLPAGPAQAKIVDTLADPALAMTINGRAYPARVIDMMLGAAQQNKPDATWAQMLDSLTENQLIAAHALKETGRATLQAPDKVGFTPQMILEEQFNSLIKLHFFRQIDGYVKQRPKRNLDDLIVWQIAGDDSNLKELTTLRDIGEVRLTPTQRSLAEKTVVARIKLPDGSQQTITFEDIYVRMNVQGRVRVLQDRELPFLDNQIRTRVEALFVGWWAASQSGLTTGEITALKTLLEEKQLRESYVLQQGVVSTLHEDTTPALEKLQKQVTREEIRAWYDKNKQEFLQVQKVKARHIRCASEADCQKAQQALTKGMEFSAAAKQFSIADDRTASPAGNLGWILRAEKNLPWLHQLALIQKPGQVTPPIRSPEDSKGVAVWEIIRVDERVEEYSPPESETVAYLARQEIAKRKAVEQYKRLRDQLIAAADIRRNGAILKARAASEAAAAKTRPPAPAAPHGQHDGHGHRH